MIRLLSMGRLAALQLPYAMLVTAGRVLSVEHFWDTYNAGVYSSTPIVGNVCTYETSTSTSGMNRGVKLSSATLINSGGSWSTERTDNYGYDAQRDFLTSESLTGYLWTYDPAGNRSDVTVDNLNRITKTGAVSATSDILGNVTNMGGLGYSWDSLNRMTQFVGQQENYEYRADGMRVAKSTTFNNQNKSTTYRYDGQMGIEDVDVNNGATTVTDYAVGPRGIDAISATNSSGTTVSYPLYDAHGNMISTLSKGTGGTYSWASERVYDAWGNITSGNGTGDPKGRYCAGLGHKQDDESGLIYMRARYYDPVHGRFMSEDPQCSGPNWYLYCMNRPADQSDSSGCAGLLDFLNNPWLLAAIETGRIIGGYAFIAISFVQAVKSIRQPAMLAAAVASAEAAVAIIAIAFSGNEFSRGAGLLDAMVALGVEKMLFTAASALAAGAPAANGIACAALFAAYAYSAILIGCLVSNAVDDLQNT